MIGELSLPGSLAEYNVLMGEQMGTALTDVNGIGRHSAQILDEHGYKNVEELASTTVELLCKVPGFGPSRAANVIRSAKEIILVGNAPETRDTQLESDIEEQLFLEHNVSELEELEFKASEEATPQKKVTKKKKKKEKTAAKKKAEKEPAGDKKKKKKSKKTLESVKSAKKDKKKKKK